MFQNRHKTNPIRHIWYIRIHINLAFLYYNEGILIAWRQHEAQASTKNGISDKGQKKTYLRVTQMRHTVFFADEQVSHCQYHYEWWGKMVANSSLPIQCQLQENMDNDAIIVNERKSLRMTSKNSKATSDDELWKSTSCCSIFSPFYFLHGAELGLTEKSTNWGNIQGTQ